MSDSLPTDPQPIESNTASVQPEAEQSTTDLALEKLEELGISIDDDNAAAATDDVPLDNTQPQEEPDPLLKGFANKRNNRIPYDRVVKITAKAREEARAAALAEAQRIREKYAQYESPQFQFITERLQTLAEDPERFLETLAHNDPRYAALLRKNAQAPAPQQSSPAQAIAPDIQYPDGSVGYSQEAFDRLLNAKLEAYQTSLEDKFSERIRPFEERNRQEQFRTKAWSKIQSYLADAQTWPGFVEHQADIAAALKADQNVSLEQAYRNVVFGKLSASRDSIRQQVLAEINSKAKASQPRPNASEPASPNTTSMSTVDLAMHKLRERRAK